MYRPDMQRKDDVLSIPGKNYGKLLIYRMMERTKEEQVEFRSGRRYVDQIFALKQLVEK